MPPEKDDVFDRIAALRAAGEEFCVVTVVRTENATSAKAGAKAVINQDGESSGFLGGNCVQSAVRTAARAALAAGEPRLIRVKPKDEVRERTDTDGTELHGSGCPSGGTVDLFIEPMRRAPCIAVFGESPVAGALADLGARLGYRMREIFPSGRAGGSDLDELGVGDFVVVATQGRGDREALYSALSSQAGYVAFVGSRRKAATLTGQLREKGLEESQIARLSSPAGLDIHAIEPSEIALSILGEIIARRRHGARKLEKDADGDGGI